MTRSLIQHEGNVETTLLLVRTPDEFQNFFILMEFLYIYNFIDVNQQDSGPVSDSTVYRRCQICYLPGWTHSNMLNSFFLCYVSWLRHLYQNVVECQQKQSPEGSPLHGVALSFIRAIQFSFLCKEHLMYSVIR